MSLRAWIIGCVIGLVGFSTSFLVLDRGTQAPVARYRVIAEYPHDPKAFCQGLVFDNGILYESTGQHGQSTLRQVDLATGQVEKMMKLGDDYFGEGLAAWNGTLIQLTWRNGVAFVYDQKTLGYIESFRFTPEGWGLTFDGKHLILSDGTSELRRLDPATRRVVGKIKVRDDAGRPIARLNELEFIEEEIWANVWQTDRIVRISPESGQVRGWVDLTGLLPRDPASPEAGGPDVLNGIAYDADRKRLFVTGKHWPKLFEIQIEP